MATTILLVRHAAHPLLGKVLCGRMAGVELDGAGRDQAARLGTRIAVRKPDALFTSSLSRARDTAQAIADASGLVVQPCEALDEIDFGDWTGARFDDLEGDPRWVRWNGERAKSCPPGGEPMQQAQSRVVAGIHQMKTSYPHGTVVAVSHADIIKAALLWCIGLTLDAHMRFDIDPASSSALVLWDGGGRLMWMNEGVTA
ncbi:histidine phosphatase family protein [Dankookia rubra]|nr:histidine phosphatase family protein [Dankookia rubra]